MYPDQSERPCRACGAPLLFVKTAEGRTMPLDLRAPTYIVRDGIAVRATLAHVSHFSTCRKAGEFSRKKEA